MSRETAPPDLTFEAALARLEQIVREMEEASVPLQRMLALFEEGTHLGRRCQELLDTAELRISQVMQDGDGGARVRAFPLDNGADAAPAV